MPLLILASPTEVLKQLHAQQQDHAPTVALPRNTSVPKVPLLLLDQSLKSNLRSTLTDPWKLDSPSIKISTTTNLESTDILQDKPSEDTPLKSLVGVLIIGSLPTLGELVSEKMDSSELHSVNAVLTVLSMLANHFEQLSPKIYD